MRVETNKLGFCHTHFEQMRACKNRLSLALMLQSHLQHLQEEMSKKSLFRSKSAKRKTVSAVNESCFVCSKIEWGMSRIMRTLFEMYEQQEEFRKLFEQQQMLCLPHYELLTEMMEQSLDKKLHKRFSQACADLMGGYLSELEKDVSHFCKMYDYRNTGAGADWGNSKDSVERAIKFLTTR